MRLIRYIGPEYAIPRWWGVVRHDYMRWQTIIATIGLSTVLRLGWIAWDWIKCPFRSHKTWTERRTREIAAKLEEHYLKIDAERQDAYDRRITKAAENLVIKGWKPEWADRSA